MKTLHGVALGKNMSPFVQSYFAHVSQDFFLLLGRQLAKQGQASNDQGNIGVLNDGSP
jgi:hypothetical protein